jgi:hypothetical protein
MMSSSTAVVIFSYICQTNNRDVRRRQDSSDQGNLGLRKVIHNYLMKVLKNL